MGLLFRLYYQSNVQYDEGDDCEDINVHIAIVTILHKILFVLYCMDSLNLQYNYLLILIIIIQSMY